MIYRMELNFGLMLDIFDLTPQPIIIYEVNRLLFLERAAIDMPIV